MNCFNWTLWIFNLFWLHFNILLYKRSYRVLCLGHSVVKNFKLPKNSIVFHQNFASKCPTSDTFEIASWSPVFFTSCSRWSYLGRSKVKISICLNIPFFPPQSPKEKFLVTIFRGKSLDCRKSAQRYLHTEYRCAQICIQHSLAFGRIPYSL